MVGRCQWQWVFNPTGTGSAGSLVVVLGIGAIEIETIVEQRRPLEV
jgi:hypothetical protein